MAFCFTTTANGYTTAYSVDRSATNAPELVIEYTTVPPLSISADKASGTYTDKTLLRSVCKMLENLFFIIFIF